MALADPELNKHRVQTRVSQGGHPVAEEKIPQRYFHTMNNLYDALKIADSAFLFDNSASEPTTFILTDEIYRQSDTEINKVQKLLGHINAM